MGTSPIPREEAICDGSGRIVVFMDRFETSARPTIYIALPTVYRIIETWTMSLMETRVARRRTKNTPTVDILSQILLLLREKLVQLR